MHMHTPKLWSEIDPENHGFIWQVVYAALYIVMSVPIAVAMVKILFG